MPKLVPIKKESSEIGISEDSSHYPYGTELNFHDDLVDELQLGDLEVGSEVTVVGKATVTRKSESSRQALGDQSDDRKSVDVQLTSVQVTSTSTDEDVLKQLYGND